MKNKWIYSVSTVFGDMRGIVRGNGMVVERWDYNEQKWVQDDRFFGAYLGLDSDFKVISQEDVKRLLGAGALQ